MDLRHVHLIPRLTGKGSSVSQTFPQVNQHLNSKEEINLKISSCYATPAVIRKLKHSTLFHIRKQLAECLILSKIDYNDIVSHVILCPCPVGRCSFRSWALYAYAGCNQTRMDINKGRQRESYFT